MALGMVVDLGSNGDGVVRQSRKGDVTDVLQESCGGSNLRSPESLEVKPGVPRTRRSAILIVEAELPQKVRWKHVQVSLTVPLTERQCWITMWTGSFSINNYSVFLCPRKMKCDTISKKKSPKNYKNY